MEDGEADEGCGPEGAPEAVLGPVAEGIGAAFSAASRRAVSAGSGMRRALRSMIGPSAGALVLREPDEKPVALGGSVLDASPLVASGLAASTFGASVRPGSVPTPFAGSGAPALVGSGFGMSGLPRSGLERSGLTGLAADGPAFDAEGMSLLRRAAWYGGLG